MKKFTVQNKKTLICMFGLVAVISLLYIVYKPAKDFFVNISIILAIPSFLISFVVLNVLNVTPKELDRYYHSRKIKDTNTELNRSDFKNYLGDKLGPTNNTLQLFERYLKHKNTKNEINVQMINDCKKKYQDLSDFYFNTSECVYRETLTITITKDSLSTLDPTDYSDVHMSEENFRELGNLLKNLSDDYFKQEELSTDKLENLTKIFDMEVGLFKKYFSICKLTFKGLGGETNE